MFAELLMREREDMRFLTTGMSMEDPSCSYEIDVQVPSIFNLGKTVLHFPGLLFYDHQLMFSLQFQVAFLRYHRALISTVALCDP